MAVHLTSAANFRVDFGDIAAIDSLTSISVAFTVTPQVAQLNNRLVTKWGNVSGQPAFLAQVIDTSNILFVVNNGLGTLLRGDKTTDGPLALGLQSRVVCRWRASDSEVNIWSNGVARTDTSVFGNAVTAIGGTSTNVQVGHESAENVSAQEGDYSEVAIWGRYLSDAEVIHYGKGYSPDYFRSGGIMYCPMYSTGNLAERWNSFTGTNLNGTSASHPPTLRH